MFTTKNFLDNFEEIKNSILERSIDIDLENTKNKILAYKKDITDLNAKKHLFKNSEVKDKNEKLIISNKDSELKKNLFDIQLELNKIPNIIKKTYGKNEEINLFSYNLNETELTSTCETTEKENLKLSIDNLFLKLNSHFLCLKEDTAILKRELENLLIRNALSKNYNLLDLPVLTTKNALERSGHLFFFKENIFSCNENMYLIPTSEVSILDFFYKKDLKEEKKFCCLSNCFRREGAYGARDKYTRFYQFNKLELFTFCFEENKYLFLEDMIQTGCRVLEELGLSFYVKKNSPIDTSFHAEITYDIFVKTSLYGDIEVSSCSSIGKYQTQANKTTINKKISCSLNGTAFGVERLILSILDKYKTVDKAREIISKLDI